MNIAFCIISHQYSPIIEEFIHSMRGAGTTFFLHVDLKTDIHSYSSLFNCEDIIFIKNRIYVNWGTFSQIEAYLTTLRITKSFDFDYIFLVSGDTLAIRDKQKIKEILLKKWGCEFISVKKMNESVQDRLKFIYPVDDPRSRNILGRYIGKFQRRFKLYKKNPYFLKMPSLYFGSNWFAITSACRDYIFEYLKSQPFYLDAFRFSCCGDELFFQTIIMNSSFSTSVEHGGIMYVDWETGPNYPRVLDEHDYERIKNSCEDTSLMFARKFNPALNIRLFRNFFWHC